MKFQVWSEDIHEDISEAVTIEEIGPREAAVTWAAREDRRGDYAIVGGRMQPVVSVVAPDGTVTRWHVDGEAIPSYQARPASLATASET